MRINTDGKYGWREDEIAKAAEVVGRNKTDSVIQACSHLAADQEAKRELADYLAVRVLDGTLEPSIATDITEILGDSDAIDYRSDLVFAPTVEIDVTGEVSEGSDG